MKSKLPREHFTSYGEHKGQAPRHVSRALDLEFKRPARSGLAFERRLRGGFADFEPANDLFGWV